MIESAAVPRPPTHWPAVLQGQDDLGHARGRQLHRSRAGRRSRSPPPRSFPAFQTRPAQACRPASACRSSRFSTSTSRRRGFRASSLRADMIGGAGFLCDLRRSGDQRQEFARPAMSLATIPPYPGEPPPLGFPISLTIIRWSLARASHRSRRKSEECAHCDGRRRPLPSSGHSLVDLFASYAYSDRVSWKLQCEQPAQHGIHPVSQHRTQSRADGQRRDHNQVRGKVRRSLTAVLRSK